MDVARGLSLDIYAWGYSWEMSGRTGKTAGVWKVHKYRISALTYEVPGKGKPRLKQYFIFIFIFLFLTTHHQTVVPAQVGWWISHQFCIVLSCLSFRRWILEVERREMAGAVVVNLWERVSFRWIFSAIGILSINNDNGPPITLQPSITSVLLVQVTVTH